MEEPSPEHWYAALSSPHGIVLKVNDPVAAQQRLYQIRANLADPDLDNVTINTSPNPGELWLVKRRPE